MVTIKTVSEELFSLNGFNFAKIYQPLRQGENSIGIYNVYDTRQQLISSTRFDEYEIDGVVCVSVEETVEKLLNLVFDSSLSELKTEVLGKTDSGGYDGTTQDLKNELDAVVFEGAKTYASIEEANSVDPFPEDGTPMKVSGEGRYYASGGVWIPEDSDLNNDINNINDFEAVSGQFVEDLYLEKEKSLKKVLVDEDFALKKNLTEDFNLIERENFSVGWIDFEDGHLVGQSENNNAQFWVTTGFKSVESSTEVKRVSDLISPVNQSIAIVSFWDENQNYLGGFNDSPFLAETSIVVSDYFDNTKYIRVTYIASSTKELYINFEIPIEKISGLNERLETSEKVLSSVENLTSEKEVVFSEEGYKDLQGEFVENGSFLATPLEEVFEGQFVYYKGVSGSLVSPLASYNAEGEFVSGLLDYGTYTEEEEIVIPEGVKYISASARKNEGDVFLLKTKDIKKPELNYFLPKNMYAVQGDLFRIYSEGVFKRERKDVRWTLGNGSKDFWELNALYEDEDVVEVGLKTSDIYGNEIDLGSTNVNITHEVKSPDNAINIIDLGDSTVQGVNSIEGAQSNEFSRRLTGTGTAQGFEEDAYLPPSLNLSNIYFRGTLGDQPILHEGRGGWSADNYLSVSSLGGVTNAFWNPVSEEFDLSYYLEQNNFKASQTLNGVNDTGSNLIIYITLGWNDIRISGIEEAVSKMQELIDKIKSTHPEVKIKLTGMTTPSETILRYDKENWNKESVMQEYILSQAVYYTKLAEENENVKYIHVASNFSSFGAYPVFSKRVDFRSILELDVVRDNVHPISAGYAKKVDVLFNEFIFENCRLN